MEIYDRLVAKEANYLKWIKKHQDPSGFIDTDHCDALLFSGLLSCHPDVDIKLEDCRDVDGSWHRRPTKDCFSSGGSKSTISRDMLLGLLWGAYYNKRLDIIEGVINYAFKNIGIMGKAVDKKVLFGRCFMTPSLLATYAIAARELGGKNRWWLTWIPTGVPKGLKGFQAHLAVLHLFIRKKLERTDKYDSILMDYYTKEPNNPLFALACGHSVSAEMIMDLENFWPSDRLPTNHDRKESWLPQRSEGIDWLPATDRSKKEWHGGDFLFLMILLRESLYIY